MSSGNPHHDSPAQAHPYDQAAPSAPSPHKIPAFPFRTDNPAGPSPAPASPAHERPQPIQLYAVRPEDVQPIYSHLILLGHELHAATTAIIQLRDQAAATHDRDFEETITPGPTVPPLRVDYHGRRHVLVWTPAAQSIVITFDGIGAETRSLTAGWTVIDPPSGAKISAATAITLRVRYTNDVPPGLVG